MIKPLNKSWLLMIILIQAGTTDSTADTEASPSTTTSSTTTTVKSTTTPSTTTVKTTTTKPEIGYNNTCNISHERNPCKTKNATCQQLGNDKRCMCASDNFYQINEDTCVSKIGYNNPCNISYEGNPCKTKNATCQQLDNDKRCMCASDKFYHINEDTCESKIGYNNPCNISHEGNPCKTKNATCQQLGNDKRCMCASDNFYHINEDTCESKIAYNHSCNINYEGSPCTTKNATCQQLEDDKRCLCASDNFYYETDDTCFPVPSPPQNGSIFDVTEYTFTIKWRKENPQSYTDYDIILPEGATVHPNFTRINDTFYRFNSNISILVISNLVAGKQYNISIYTVKVFNDLWIRSTTALNRSTYTVPLAPQNVTLPENGINDNSFVINLHDSDPAFTNWTIEVIKNETSKTVYNETYRSDNTNEDVEVGTNLTSGTSYTAYISTSVPGYNSRNKTTMPFFTRPRDPATLTVTDDAIDTTGFVVNVTAENERFDHYFLSVCEGNDCHFEGNESSTENQIVVTNLTSGTGYNCTLYTVLENGLKSSTPKKISVYTRPNHPESVTNSTVHERNITINISTSNDRYDGFLVSVYSYGELIANNTTKDPVYNITNLDPAKLYNVTVYTIIRNNLTSTESFLLNFTTRPETPGNGSVGNVDLHKIRLNFAESNSQFDSFYVQYKEANQTHHFTVNHTPLYTERDNLTAGTLYAFEVYTYFQGLLSDGNGWIISYTKPEQIRNLNVNGTTNTSLQLQWDPPNEGLVDNYTVSYDCIGPNNDSVNFSNEKTVPEQNFNLSRLSPGTFCIASITTMVGNQEGYAKVEALPVSTDENGPDVVEAEIVGNFGSRYIDVQWKRPSKRNGLINKYEITASLNDTTVATGILNCSVCTIQTNLTDLQQFVKDCASATRCDNNGPEDSFHYNFTDLHPFREYTFSITAFTQKEGRSKTITWNTREDKPEGPPQNINGSSDKFTLKLKWEPPSYDVRNGIITNYIVQYSFTSKTCFNSSDVPEVNISTLSDNQTETNLTNLLPFTDYHIQIKASTSVGYGNYSGITTVRTKQSVPSKIDISRTNQTVTNESIKLDWETPCPANGIITNYTIQIRNVNPNDTKPDSNKTTQTNDTTVTIEGLMPYRNYTISISGNTIAGGNYSDEFNVTTNISIPKSPENISVIAISSKELEVTWNKPSLLNYTGPTHYVVVVKDKRNETAENTTYGFENNNCIVNDLEEYWSYTVNVTAITKEGSTTSASTDGQTRQDVPLEVESIEVLPQENVTLKRSIFVKWSPPTELNKNGIIINYYVGYSSISLEKSKVFGLPPTSNEYTIENISPGNYTVTVYAATSVGNGTHSNKSAELLPGAPLKVPENRTNPLMREASLQVSNKKKELAIILPTDSFLCNRTNGVPIEWGVVVAQDSEATDTPYNGDKAGFEKKKETYMAWSSVKDKDSIPPYIATPINWSPCSFSSGTRRRRSTNHQITTFTVGEDGDCSGRCNGALQPGRDYRVKSYVCTQNGCTETLYSVPISTEPDPTIPIVAGVVSALAVITMAAVVVFLLKRRQVACFSKDVENKPSHRPGNEITLDNIEPKQKNAFRPGPIKLADFPGEVEKMHRDSDLLFADAYKLLKDKSPNHPLTAAEQQCSRPKNRYTNILPFDHSRVKLRPSDDIEGSDYINANYIPGYSSRREYIATQGPMIATFDDFWRMVWEQNVDTIVMLTKLMEKGRRKCDKYWPDIGEPVFYGDLVVSLQSESNLSDYTIKIFEIKMKEERKVVTHFSYLKWPDMGCPETPELLLDFVKAVRQYTNRDKKPSPGPIVVHCSAGVGRTGTFIAVDYLLQHIRDHDDVDIYNLVLEMRNHRLNMVQTEDQYVYIHECLKAFITTDEEEEEEDEEPLYMNTEKEDEHIYVNTAFTKD